MSSVERFSDLANQVLERPNELPTRLIGVDGCGGSGKSTFAKRLVNHLSTEKLIHTDDFASWDNPLNWWPRLLEQVIKPISKGEQARWQRYDWGTKQLAEWHKTEPGGVVVIEGVTATREAWRDLLAYRIWVECPRDLRLQRGLERDGPDAYELWQDWMAAEDEYVEKEKSKSHADLVVDGSVYPDNSEEEFIRLRP